MNQSEVARRKNAIELAGSADWMYRKSAMHSRVLNLLSFPLNPANFF